MIPSFLRQRCVLSAENFPRGLTVAALSTGLNCFAHPWSSSRSFAFETNKVSTTRFSYPSSSVGRLATTELTNREKLSHHLRSIFQPVQSLGLQPCTRTSLLHSSLRPPTSRRTMSSPLSDSTRHETGTNPPESKALDIMISWGDISIRPISTP